MKKLLVLVLCLVFASSALAGEREKKIEAETGTGVGSGLAPDCEGAIPIACGGVYNGTTVGGVSNVTSYSCVSWSETGPEKIFVITTTGTNTISAALSGLTADLDVFIMSSCSETACIAYGDNTASASCKPAGTYYIAVDGYVGASGPFTLTVTCTACAGPPANDTCAGAINIPCGTINLAGNMSGANNDYTPGVYPTSCTGYSALGADVVYKFSALAGQSVSLTYTSVQDGSFYIVTDCANPSTSCVVGADATFTNQPEVINYTFTSAGTYYLILDNYTSPPGSTWTLTGTYTCPPTAAEQSTWGAVKTLYR